MDARDLSERLADLLRREHSALADFLVTLADFDRRRWWLELGHASLFAFLHRELGLSKGAAYYRKVAAELVQRFPEVVEPLRDGRLCITSVVELAKVLTPENRRDVLPRFFHASKQEAKAVAAELRPMEVAPRRDVVTALAPASTTSKVAAGADRGTEAARSAAAREAPLPATTADPTRAAADACSPARDQVAVHPDEPRACQLAETPRNTAEPITAELRRLHVTVSRRFLAKLDAARAALSHAHPGAGVEKVLEAALDLLLDAHAKKKGVVKRPRTTPKAVAGADQGDRSEVSTVPANDEAHADSASRRPASESRYVPAAVRREVWIRDAGRCKWPLAAGGICGSTLRVELDHQVPRALGGPSTASNLRVLCKVHNDLAARQAFGDAWMDRYTRGAVAKPAPIFHSSVSEVCSDR
jgi:hypothetical protein